MSNHQPQFWMGGIHATDLQEVTDDYSRLDDGGFWAVTITFEGIPTFAKFATVRKEDFPKSSWQQLSRQWVSSLRQDEYEEYVAKIQSDIAAGGVYQVNACRILTHAITSQSSDLSGLFSKLLEGNPAAHACYLAVEDVEIASASPELFLLRTGSDILTSPIKGTLPSAEKVFGDKDKAENLMIVDLMRNDFGRICSTGSVEVSELFRVENHPGINHLVSDVRGKLQKELSWQQLLQSILAPGSVSGAPKSSAVKIIAEHEGSRGPYCGVLGWIEGDRAELAVAIRTFWRSGESHLHFGTGAGITWGSDPKSEWEETQLKASHLISIAGGVL